MDVTWNTVECGMRYGYGDVAGVPVLHSMPVLPGCGIWGRLSLR